MSKPFPSPWRVEQIPGGFIVRDAERKPIAYVYGQENRRPFEEGSSSPLTMDEAREMALSIARLPELRKNEAPGGCSQDTGAGKVAKRSRFDATPPPHSFSAHPPIPRLNGRKGSQQRQTA
jgi:hypothetical protein